MKSGGREEGREGERGREGGEGGRERGEGGKEKGEVTERERKERM